MKNTKGVIEYRFNTKEGGKEIVKTIRYNSLFQYIVALIKVNFEYPDTIIHHK